MTDVFVAGVGMTLFGRFPYRSVRDLARDAARQALADAGCDPACIGAAFFANSGQGALEGQHAIRGELALRDLPLGPIPIANVENACASASTAFYMAITQLRAGQADIVLAVGAEKLSHDDKARSLAVFGGSWDVHDVPGNLAALLHMGDGVETPVAMRSTGPHSVFMDVYQAFAKFHMREFGTTQRQLAIVAAKNHHHSVANERAHFRRDFSVDEVLAGRVIAWPLTLPMCSPVSDGAAAAVLCTRAALPRLDARRAVRVRASVLASGRQRPPEDYRNDVSRIAACRAYEAAGVAPADIDIAELHDATAVGEVQQAEHLMLCAFGDGGRLAESGATRIGGRIPINPSGGLEARGHPIGATGLAQIFEVVTQLRGEAGARQVAGARLAIAENGGGLIGPESAAVCVNILGQ